MPLNFSKDGAYVVTLFSFAIIVYVLLVMVA